MVDRATRGAPPKLVSLKVAASPADTEMVLDGAKLEGNPFNGQFPKDASLHRLELRSVGRVSEARMIRLDQDLDLLIALPMDKASALRARGASPAGVRPKSSSSPAREPGAPASAAFGRSGSAHSIDSRRSACPSSPDRRLRPPRQVTDARR